MPTLDETSQCFNCRIVPLLGKKRAGLTAKQVCWTAKMLGGWSPQTEPDVGINLRFPD
jgi:hypothetical protein